MLAFTVSSRAKARAGSSFRTVMRMAVLLTMGLCRSPSLAKAATLSMASSCRSSQSPRRAFHTPSTLQGAAMAKQAKMSTSTTLHPPAPRIWASQASSST